MHGSDNAVRGTKSYQLWGSAGAALALAAGVGAFALAPAQAGGSPERSLTSTQVNGADRTVSGISRGKWKVHCEGDVCSNAAPGVSAFKLPESWAGETVRLSIDATFNLRAKGTNRARVGAIIGQGETAAKRTKLAPKQWIVRQPVKGMGTADVSFTKRVTVPEDGFVYLTVDGPKKDTNFSLNGSKVLWKVTASR